ncbi:glycerate kinase, partial [Granulicella sp. S190]|uniref:glycerate kinase n=1 Tax=Granulicella sp. S190 TaxID=1747226 RepID=UPI00131B888D
MEQAFAHKVKRVTGPDGRRLLTFGDDVIDLGRLRRIGIVAVGKAAPAMLQAMLPSLQGLPECDLSGLLIANHRPDDLPLGFRFYAGGHPTPNEASIDGAKAAIELVRSLRDASGGKEETLCLFLLSGGGSAMMELPLDPKISLEDLVEFYRELVHCGGSIAEINCVRKHFSAVKGGRLALEAEGILNYSLLVSDVPSGSLDSLASGPTLPDTSTVDQCREILERYRLMERVPSAVKQFFLSTQLPETPKAPQLDAHALTLLSSADLAMVVERRAKDLGFYVVVDDTCDDWSYRAAAEYLLERLRSLRRKHRRVCLISSGEVTVELPLKILDSDCVETKERAGVGGRNQHFALYAATLLRASDESVAVLSAGTDGIDG